MLDGLVSELGVVYEAIDAVGDADEGSERDQLGDLAGGDKACLVREGNERVLLESLQRQLHLSTPGVHVDDLAYDALAHRDGVGGVVDPPPAQFGGPDETGALIDRFAVEVHEHTEVVDALYLALVCCAAPKAEKECSQSRVLAR
ncbi:hypothetical protein ATE80_23735 [Streptomyces kanasensis]|uniref:Uncharacterized protein n=1 Tax=Streptomyces kanasensis TaxID=936756 RepID=A0A100Y2E8_9ACTN|nr:hypothetical protein ATE80_23735 [Streptomyces kanasensis]